MEALVGHEPTYLCFADTILVNFGIRAISKLVHLTSNDLVSVDFQSTALPFKLQMLAALMSVNPIISDRQSDVLSLHYSASLLAGDAGIEPASFFFNREAYSP